MAGIAHPQSTTAPRPTVITTVDIGPTVHQSDVLTTVHPTDRITAEDMEATAGTDTDVEPRSESVVAVSESALGSKTRSGIRQNSRF